MIVLNAGVDSLYWSARCVVGEWFEDALRAKERARAEGHAEPWRDVRGYALDVEARSWRAYPLVVRAAEFEIRFTDSQKLPTIYAQPLSWFIQAVGIECAVEETVAVVSEITGGVGVVGASRVDPFVDFGDFRLRAEDRGGFHTRGEVEDHWDSADDEWLPSVRVGAKALKLRIYDKRRQLRKRGFPMPLAWGDFTGPVTRVEVEARSVSLRRFGISTVAEALTSYGDVWRHATTRFFVLRVPGIGPRRSWDVRPEWRAIQEAGMLRFPANGLVPFAQVKGEKVRVLQQLYGSLISLGAYQDCGELEAVIGTLRRELRVVERGRGYAEEVERRRRRLPAAVRMRQSA